MPKLGVLTCLTTFVLGVLLVIMQIWAEIFDNALFFKLLLTLSAVFAIAFATSIVMMRFAEYRHKRDWGCLGILILGVSLIMLQTWTQSINEAIFSQLLLTLAGLFVIMTAISVAITQLTHEKQMRDDDYLN